MLPIKQLPAVTITLDTWAESYVAVPSAPGTYERYATSTLTVTAGQDTQKYPLQIREADYLTAADPVALVDTAIRYALTRAYADLDGLLTPDAK